MGGSIVPALVERGEAQVYDFSTNEVPGASDADRGYWRDVGTLDAYYDAHMDLISVKPEFNLYNQEWPILTWPDPLPPAKFVFDEDGGRRGQALDSMVCAGVVISGGTVRRSVLSPGAHIHSYAEVEDCVLMQGVDIGRRAVVRRAIIDKNVRIAHGAQIGVDPVADRERFTVSAGGDRRHPQGHDGGGVKAALLTREYPPDVYGGAGVHVEYLARELRKLIDVDVHAWGADREGAIGHEAWDALAGPAPELAALRAMSIDLTMAAGTADADVVHSHTWYANLGGHLAKLVHDVPHVVTVHSLEPLRPWKAEQLGGGYALSSFCERTAVEAADAIVAVSDGMARRPAHRLPRDRPGPRVGRSTTASTPRSTRPTRAPTSSSATASTPTVPTDRLRRAHHAPEGRRAPARGHAPRRPRGPARAVRGRPGHAGDRRRGRAPRRGAAGPARQRAVARTRCCPSPR